MHLVDSTLFYTAAGGGVRTYLQAKAAWLRRHTRIRHTVLTSTGGDGADPACVAVPSLGLGHADGYRMPRSLACSAGVLCRLQPDLVEVGDPYLFAWASLRARRTLDIPLVAFCHSDLAQIAQRRFGALAGLAGRRYLASLYSRFDLVLAPSGQLVERLRALGLTRVRHQPLGVDAATFSPARHDISLRLRLGVPQQARLLVFAGRGAREKRLALLADVVKLLGPGYHLLLVGGRPEVLPPHVHHLPFQRDAAALAGILASCDALVHPGDQETFGLIVLEAMACGLPVVGVDAGGVRELVDARTGVLVEPGSSAALAEGIRLLFSRDRACMGVQARRKVLAQYDWHIIFPQLLAQYTSLLAGRTSEAACRKASCA